MDTRHWKAWLGLMLAILSGPTDARRSSNNGTNPNATTYSDGSEDWEGWWGSISEASAWGNSQPYDLTAAGLENRGTGHLISTATGDLVVIPSGDARIDHALRSYLNEEVASTITAISLLHPAADAPSLNAVAEEWSGREMLRSPAGLEEIATVFRKRPGERVFVFGHVEARLDGSGAFVVRDGRNQAGLEVPLGWLHSEAARNGIELLVVGCSTFAHGAPAGVLSPVASEDVAGIAKKLLTARRRSEIFASLGAGQQPVMIDAQQLYQAEQMGRLDVEQIGRSEPIARYYSSPKSNAGDWPDAPKDVEIGPFTWFFIIFGGAGVLALTTKLVVEPAMMEAVAANYATGRYPAFRRIIVRYNLLALNSRLHSVAAGTFGCLIYPLLLGALLVAPLPTLVGGLILSFILKGVRNDNT